MSTDNPLRVSEKSVLIASVLIAGLCSIIYELLISTTASYFLGDSVKQFSLTIGLYMASMGLGAWLSRLMKHHLLATFIGVEIALAVVGGLSVPLLYAAFAYTSMFYPAVLLLILAIGTLTGLEVPLLTRVMERNYELRFNLSNVLSLDYFGALIATLVFPFLLVPFAGVFRSALIVGLINMAVGFLNLWAFAEVLGLQRRRVFYAACISVVLLLGGMLAAAGPLIKGWSEDIYGDRVVYREQTPYQNIVLTKYKADLRLYLGGNLQFSSIDEYRYHEPLIHIPAAQVSGPLKVLMLGGGDGLAARELLKYPRLEQLTVVDLDPAMFRLARDNPHIRQLNGDSFRDPRVKTISEDAFVFLDRNNERFNLIIADLPDPKNISLARLYSREFYRVARRHLTVDGVFVTQATSPFYAREAFWSIVASLQSAGFKEVVPYHAYVPAFGEWGFVLASDQPLQPEKTQLSTETRFLQPDGIEPLFSFGKDMLPTQEPLASSIDSPLVLTHYLEGWRYWR